MDADGNDIDAVFIAHAREDVPALLAEVRRLRAELDAARAIVEGRTTPPTDEEIEAHNGDWMVQWSPHSWTFTRGVESIREMRSREWGAAIRWVPYRNGRPCAWPVVTPVAEPT